MGMKLIAPIDQLADLTEGEQALRKNVTSIGEMPVERVLTLDRKTIATGNSGNG
jgi:hypothetical protein